MTERDPNSLWAQQAMAAGADPATLADPATGISRITVPDTITNQSGVSEDIDNEVYFTEMDG